MNPPDSTSTRPYLIRALYEWCTDNGLTPYVAVSVDESVHVPREHVKNNEIVLNISFDATSSLKLGNDFIEFKARFAGSARDIMVPISRVVAIYARENGQGMAFPAPGTGPGSSDPTSSSHQLAIGQGAVALTPGSNNASAPVALASVAPAAAPTAGSRSADGKIVQLVPADGAPIGPSDDKDPPTPPKPQQGGRPSLKRVK